MFNPNNYLLNPNQAQPIFPNINLGNFLATPYNNASAIPLSNVSHMANNILNHPLMQQQHQQQIAQFQQQQRSQQQYHNRSSSYRHNNPRHSTPQRHAQQYRPHHNAINRQSFMQAQPHFQSQYHNHSNNNNNNHSQPIVSPQMFQQYPVQQVPPPPPPPPLVQQPETIATPANHTNLFENPALREKLDPSQRGILEMLKKEMQEFEFQLEKWEKDFDSWKEGNENHPDKTAYLAYLNQWQDWKNNLITRKEQMKQLHEQKMKQLYEQVMLREKENKTDSVISTNINLNSPLNNQQSIATFLQASKSKEETITNNFKDTDERTKLNTISEKQESEGEQHKDSNETNNDSKYDPEVVSKAAEALKLIQKQTQLLKTTENLDKKESVLVFPNSSNHEIKEIDVNDHLKTENFISNLSNPQFDSNHSASNSIRPTFPIIDHNQSRTHVNQHANQPSNQSEFNQPFRKDQFSNLMPRHHAPIQHIPRGQSIADRSNTFSSPNYHTQQPERRQLGAYATTHPNTSISPPSTSFGQYSSKTIDYNHRGKVERRENLNNYDALNYNDYPNAKYEQQHHQERFMGDFNHGSNIRFPRLNEQTRIHQHLNPNHSSQHSNQTQQVYQQDTPNYERFNERFNERPNQQYANPHLEEPFSLRKEYNNFPTPVMPIHAPVNAEPVHEVKLTYHDMKYFTEPHSGIVSIDDLIQPPSRQFRPQNIVIILRGLPGSGKTHIAKLIKDKEVENGGSAPRILSLDDYFMTEKDKVVKDENGKKVTTKEYIYEYESEMESSYRASLFKSFKKTIEDALFQFVIVDAINERYSHYDQFCNHALQRGFAVFVIEMDCFDVPTCHRKNIHNRKLDDIRQISKSWEKTPRNIVRLDTRSFLQDDSIEHVDMVESNTCSKRKNVTDSKEDNNSDSHKKRFDEPTNGELFQGSQSRWEKMEASDEKLDRLDAFKMRSKITMKEYLQVADDYANRRSIEGRKRVRWADIEEEKQQMRRRDVGFVVGQNWEHVMDPSYANRALTQTKYF